MLVDQSTVEVIVALGSGKGRLVASSPSVGSRRSQKTLKGRIVK